MSIKRRNAINDQWSARRREMLESPAYRALSQSAHRVISRIELELCYHGGNDNGQLPVTFEDFIEYGIERGSIAPALREGEALGFLSDHRSRQGRKSRISSAQQVLSDVCRWTWLAQKPTDGRMAQ